MNRTSCLPRSSNMHEYVSSVKRMKSSFAPEMAERLYLVGDCRWNILKYLLEDSKMGRPIYLVFPKIKEMTRNQRDWGHNDPNF